MKQIIIFLFLTTICFGQKKSSQVNELLTTKYSGDYRYGTDIEKGKIGNIIIYPETDNTILFYIDLNRGAPSYNMGSLYGRVKINNDKGIFYTKSDYAEKGCKWTFHFTENNLIIETVNQESNCGFGYAVFADGEYKRKSTKHKEFFENMEGIKIHFKTTKPEEYYTN